MEIPKHYTLHSENDDHFVLHDSRDGKQFKVAKKSMHPANQIKVMKMQKFDSGGEAMDEEDAAVPAALAANSPDPVPQDAGPDLMAGVGQVPQSMQTQAPVTSAELPQQVGGAQVPAKTPDTMAQFQANQGLEESGLKGQGAAQAKMGAENAKAYEDANTKVAKFMNDSNAPIEKLSQENDAMAQALADPKSNIDPRAYFHNMGTGGKIANAIALIVGGIGAGLTHGPNMAMQVIDNAIAKDIESQKINLGKKESLLSTNLARFKDMKMAQTATMAQMNAMVQGQVAANTAKYGGQAGAAGTQAALGQLKNNNLQAMMGLKQQVFQQQLQQHLAQGDVSKDNPLDYVRWTVPPDKQKEVATELGKSQYTAENEKHMLDLWDKANEEQKFWKTGAGVIREGPAMKELRLMGSPLIHDQMGRVNEFEQHNYEGVLPGNFQMGSTQKELRRGFQDFLENKKSAPMAKTYGIDIDRFNSMKAPAETKMVNGVKYTRGPNGEAVKSP